MSGIYHHTPCFEFLGRQESISDLVGEKLQESFVCQILERLNIPETCFKSLVPVANPPHYILLLDQVVESPQILAKNLDIALSQSIQYQRARLLDQLAPPQVFISPKIPELLALYRVRSGSIWGGVKYPILATSPINADLFNQLKFQL